jgi:hypothetical protein
MFGRKYTGAMPDPIDPNRADVDVFDYADELIEVPRSHLRLKLSQDEHGLLVTHDEQSMIRCHLTRNGMGVAGFVAQALGVPLPALGEDALARVSTGVVFRALSIARLDLSNEASFVLLERFLEEAAIQRGAAPSQA